MMRIHFTPDDLRRVTIAGPERLNEVVNSAASFMKAQLPAHEQRRFARDLTPATRPLLQIADASYGTPDFLTPAAGADFETGLDAVLSTPEEQIRAELEPFARHAWTREVNRARGMLGIAVRSYERHVFAPHWERAAASVATDRAMRSQILIEGGVDMLLATLHPRVVWMYPVLILPCVEDSDFHLRGQGVRLVPTYFQPVPSVLDRPGRQFDVIYPARVDVAAARRGGGALQSLMGRTRAAVLAAAGGGATTSQLARRLGISIASASEHATVLRNAGLIASGRRRNTMVHTLTPLGAGLVSTAEAMSGL
jgi:DNA-binding transcriptional ArsR family regulator